MILFQYRHHTGNHKDVNQSKVIDVLTLRTLQKKKLKVRKLRATIKPKAITEGVTEDSMSPDLVDRIEVDYEAESHSRQEAVDKDGNIVGSYSYKDPNGECLI